MSVNSREGIKIYNYKIKNVITIFEIVITFFQIHNIK